MNRGQEGVTHTELMAAACKILENHGYVAVTQFDDWDTPSARLYEDEYGVVGLVVFETGRALAKEWPSRQGSLVEVISTHVGRQEQKAWDGYLVLLTPSIAPSEATPIDEIRADTTRLRKLVGTGEEINGLGDVERILRPLLPLKEVSLGVDVDSTLDVLPVMLSEKGLERGTIEHLVAAFRLGEPLMESLRQRRKES